MHASSKSVSEELLTLRAVKLSNWRHTQTTYHVV